MKQLNKYKRQYIEQELLTEDVVVKYTLKKKNDFEYHIKSSKKVISKIGSYKGEYYLDNNLGRTFVTIQDAIKYFIQAQEDFLNAMTDKKYQIIVEV